MQTLVTGAVEQGVYRPEVDRALLRCLEVLPWWGPQVAHATQALVRIQGRNYTAADL